MFPRKITLAILSLAILCISVQAEVAMKLAGPEFKLIQSGTGKYSVNVKLFSDQKLPKTEIAVTILPIPNSRQGETQKATVKSEKSLVALDFQFDFTQTGIYEIHAVAKEAETGNKLTEQATMIAIVPKIDDPPSDMGVVTHFGQPNWQDIELMFDYIKLAGFTSIRDELYWDILEQKPGQFIFPQRYDEYLKSAQEHGLHPLIILNYGNPLYREGVTGRRGFPNSPETREKFTRYVKEVVSRYGQIVKEWELWNEPNDIKPVQYLELLKTVRPVLRQLQPDGKLISCGGGGAGGGVNRGYISPLVGPGKTELQDAFSLHPYMSPYQPDLGYTCGPDSPIRDVSITGVLRFMKPFQERNPLQNGKPLPLWITEIGWSTGISDMTTEMEQAAYLQRTWLLARRMGNAEKIFWYDFRDDGIRPAQRENCFGLIRADYSPKPSYIAAVTFAAMIGNKTFAKALREDEFRFYQFGKDGDDCVFALWNHSRENQKFEIDAPEGITALEVIDWQSRRHEVKPSNGKFQLRVGGMPVFLKMRSIQIAQ